MTALPGYVEPVWERARDQEPDPAAGRADSSRSAAGLRSTAPTHVLQLQRTAGNAATALLLSRSALQPATEPTVQREVETVEMAELERIRDINRQAWVGGAEEDELSALWAGFPDLETTLLDPAHWAEFTASLDAGMDLPDVAPIVKIWLIHENAWVGPDNETVLARLWARYGSELPDKATEYEPTWRTSLERGMDPDDIPLVQELTRSLEDDVRAVAGHYLGENLAAVRDERAKLGLGVLPAEHDPAAARDELVRNAELLRQLLGVRESLRGIVVGRRLDETAVGDGAPDDDVSSDPLEVAFDPTSPPDLAPEPGDAMLPWDVVDSAYKLATSGLLAVAATSPVLYGALESGRLDELDPAVRPEDVAATAGVILFELETNILDTLENLEGSLDWRELDPIIGQLTQGAIVDGGSGVDWSGPFHASLVRDEVGDYETVRNLQDLGWMIPAVALMFTPIGWPALVAGGLLTAAELTVRYDRWDDLRAAADAGTSASTELVASTQAQVAEAELIVATVMGLVGVAADAGALVGAARLRPATPAADAVQHATAPAAEGGGAAAGHAAGEPQGERLFTDQDVQQAVDGLEEAAPVGIGLRGFERAAADIDEPVAVSKGGAWDDAANKRFLERTTNQLTKNDLTELAPSPPGGRISLKDAKAAGPHAFRRAAMGMLDRSFAEVDELAAVTRQARDAMQNLDRSVSKLRDAINSSIRRRIAKASGPEARLVHDALRAIGIDPHGIKTGAR